MTTFTLTIDGASSCFGETENAERAKIAHLLQHAAREMMTGTVRGGELLDGNNKPVGRFTFEPAER